MLYIGLMFLRYKARIKKMVMLIINAKNTKYELKKVKYNLLDKKYNRVCIANNP